MTHKRGVVKIGNARGRIALYLDKREAYDLAAMFSYPDKAGPELLAAIDLAYPKRESDREFHETLRGSAGSE